MFVLGVTGLFSHYDAVQVSGLIRGLGLGLEFRV